MALSSPQKPVQSRECHTGPIGRQAPDGELSRGRYCMQYIRHPALPLLLHGGSVGRVARVLSISLVNLKPGTGKTTSAVWLAHALHARGLRVLLVDADPAASALRWSDLADGFPFRVAGLPVKDLHRRIPDVAGGMDAAIVDVPQIEDHAGIARSAMRWARELILPVAPSGVELDRMAPIRKEVEDLEAVRPDGARSSVLLNRVVSGAASGPMARRVLSAQGHTVLSTTVPRLELYAQSFGAPIDARGSAYDALATELLTRDESSR